MLDFDMFKYLEIIILNIILLLTLHSCTSQQDRVLLEAIMESDRRDRINKEKEEREFEKQMAALRVARIEREKLYKSYSQIIGKTVDELTREDKNDAVKWSDEQISLKKEREEQIKRQELAVNEEKRRVDGNYIYSHYQILGFFVYKRV